uniref:Uncharacterized protein n=1 Tax=Arundo donax TaxID=35708 RepID=A0A0A9AWV8_ARUDO
MGNGMDGLSSCSYQNRINPSQYTNRTNLGNILHITIIARVPRDSTNYHINLKPSTFSTKRGHKPSS